MQRIFNNLIENILLEHKPGDTFEEMNVALVYCCKQILLFSYAKFLETKISADIN
jgi:hypothetical protein